MPRVLLDCDPGHDDAVAILIAAGWDAIELAAVTTVGGNAELAKVTHNAARVMTLAGLLDVPLAAGAAGPRNGTLVTAPDVHGESGLDGAELPQPAIEPDPRGALALMADHAPLPIVATGPLTNVAALLERDPAAATEVVWMGGSTGRGNTRPYAEFNAFVDPEAVAAVLAGSVPLTMVGLNLTHQAMVTPGVEARIAALGTPVARIVADWMAFFAGTYRRRFGLAGPPLHDACALALAGDPTLVRCVDAHMAVELTGEHTRGATVVDLHGRLGLEPNARIAVELDVERFWELVVAAIGSL